MAQEVGSPLVQVLVAACDHGGMAVDGLLSGLHFSREDLMDPASRVDWEDFTLLLDRMLEAAGSGEALEALIAEGPRLMASPEMKLDAFPDLRTFFIWMVTSLTQVLHSNLQTTTKLREDGLILCEYHIPQPYRSCRALAFGSLAIFRGVPRIFGLPDADVSCTFDDRCGLFLVDLPVSPDSGLCVARLTEDSQKEAKHNRNVSRYLSDEVERSPLSVKLGRDLLQAESMTDLGQRLGEGLRVQGGCSSGRIWIRGKEGDLKRVHVWGSGFVPVGTRMLTMGARILGRIEVSHLEALEMHELFSWASVAIDRLLEKPDSSRVREVPPGFLQRMRLTPRQRQVLFLLVQGLTDKEIAQTTGTSPKTVGHQVGALLKKGGVTSRTALASCCLGHGARPLL